MSDDIEQIIFRQELTHLHGDYELCKDANVKKRILEDIELLNEAIELLS